ncbi:MAG: hypothetical protein HY897_15580 [Deltaproteobacteria bacterium]|nr:hypothetical protein [Deltaproteobacteria bacterium]
MKTRMNKEWMKAVLPVAMLVAAACGMPDDEGDEAGLGDLGEAAEYGKAKPGTTVSPTYALKYTDVKVSGQVPVSKSSFPIASTVDVYIAVDYTNLTGSHAQSVRVFAPDGSLYQKFDKSICIGSSCTSGAAPETIGSVSQYWESLPVAGTYITQYSLSGSWRVDLYVDGVKKQSGTFLLN